jgi:hypothetical protein
VRRAPRFDDAGQMAGMEAVPFGLLIFVIGSLLLANAWAVVDAKLAVTASAREATRAFVEASTGGEAVLAAHAAARSSIAGHGRNPNDLELSVDAAVFGRCTPVVAHASLAVSSINLPFIGGFGRTFEVRATHSEIVDPYRSGLEGEATCAG